MASVSYLQLKRDLEQSIPAARLVSDPLRLLTYGTDASFYRLVPKLVVVADTEEEVRAVLAACRRHGAPVTFRAAGTSLSGQAVTDSVLLMLGEGWRGCEIGPGAETIRLQPGVLGGVANRSLAPHGRKIGPDPASLDAAMIGGIAANNASGMCCGTGRSTRRASSSPTARCSIPATRRAAPSSPAPTRISSAASTRWASASAATPSSPSASGASTR